MADACYVILTQYDSTFLFCTPNLLLQLYQINDNLFIMVSIGYCLGDLVKVDDGQMKGEGGHGHGVEVDGQVQHLQGDHPRHSRLG